jgi:tight adherence protein C
MNSGLGLAVLAIMMAAAAFVLIVYEVHARTLDIRVSKAVAGVGGRSLSFNDLAVWLSSVGMRYRRFYSSEDLEELRSVIQSSGFNPHRTVSIWVGVKIVSMVLLPLVFFFVAAISGKPPMDALIYTLIGLVIGIMGPRFILLRLKQRFHNAVRRGTPDAIDLLVVCSEAGMGLESALERVGQEMTRSNAAVAFVLYRLLDDLRVLPNRRDAFDNLGARSEGLRRFGSLLSQSVQYGTPLGQALRAIADELRRDSLIKLEERAHRLGAKLTVPMVLFFLPAMFVVLGGSSFLHLVRTFQTVH